MHIYIRKYIYIYIYIYILLTKVLSYINYYLDAMLGFAEQHDLRI